MKRKALVLNRSNDNKLFLEAKIDSEEITDPEWRFGSLGPSSLTIYYNNCLMEKRGTETTEE